MPSRHAFFLVLLFLFCLVAPLTAQQQQRRTKPDSNTETTTTTSTPTGSYYSLLEVAKDATEAEIKKNYRKLALIHHPDKASNDAEKEEKQQIFVKLANAYEILSEPRTRTRYDYLLSIGELEYSIDRDWTQFDAEHGFQPIISAEHRRQKAAHEEQLRRAYEQFKAAEEVRETFALWAALIGGGLVASVPLIWQWRQRSARERSRRVAVSQARHLLRQDQEIVKELRAQQEAEAAQIAEENRLRAAELRALRAQQAEEDSEEEEEERPADQVDENGEQADDEQEQNRRNKKKGPSTVLKCELCNKKFKSANQRENHNQSAAHKKAERVAEIEEKRAARAHKK